MPQRLSITLNRTLMQRWKVVNKRMRVVDTFGGCGRMLRMVSKGTLWPEDAAEAGRQLKAAREAAALRFLEIAAALKAEAGVKEHRIRKSLSGWARVKDAIITAPEGRTRKQLYILAHECAHVALNHHGKKPKHVQELEAEQWAHAALRRHGVAVPRSMTKRAKEYVGRKIRQAKVRGAKNIDRAAAAFAKSR
jgi:hypothetical protein